MAFSLKYIRQFSSTSHFMSSRLPKRSNPGLRFQINAIEDAAEVIQSDPEGFGGLESDLFNAHQSYKDHELESQHQNEKIKQCIIKSRYFRKDPLPNLLTYAEKEHIRYLHSTDEEEWTVEKLAESFPANSEIISKILKARWNPISSKRIHCHDVSVSKNWERFNNGEYKANMSTELYEHLKKFADRGENNINSSHELTKVLKNRWQKPINNEFSTIISSLKPQKAEPSKLKAPHHMSNDKELRTNNLDDETYLLGKIIDKKSITIHELKNKRLLKTTENSTHINSNNSLHQMPAQKIENSIATGTVSEKNFDYTDKFVSNEFVIDEFDRKRYEMSATKQRVHIPRKLWRKGATYRVNNCYYDDDGEFLYKVPGMLK